MSQNPDFEEQEFKEFLNKLRERDDVSLPSDDLIEKTLEDVMTEVAQEDSEKCSQLSYEEKLIQRIGPHALSERLNIEAILNLEKIE